MKHPKLYYEKAWERILLDVNILELCHLSFNFKGTFVDLNKNSSYGCIKPSKYVLLEVFH